MGKVYGVEAYGRVMWRGMRKRYGEAVFGEGILRRDMGKGMGKGDGKVGGEGGWEGGCRRVMGKRYGEEVWGRGMGKGYEEELR